ncbi:MAG: TlpA disulfide reductase family protein [Bacteroidetes bacterium]|nr:TlpA disulfide reductase family protein [Bacteroidota bacterium]
MKRILILILFFLSVMVVTGQHRIDINMTVFDTSDGGIRLMVWKNGRDFEVVKGMMTKGRGTIDIDDSVGPGRYSLFFDKGSLRELKFIYTKESISLEPKITPGGNNLMVKGNGETPVYYSFRTRLDSLYSRISQYRRMLNAFSDEKRFYDITMNFMKRDLEKVDSLYSLLDLEYKSSLFIHFLKASRFWLPDFTLGPVSQRQELLDHFFTWFNPLDSLLLQSSEYRSKVEEYFVISENADSKSPVENLKIAIDRFMEKVQSSEPVTEATGSLMRSWLNRQGYDDVAEYLDVKYLSQQCRAGSDINLNIRLEAYKRLAIGHVAPDISWSNGGKDTLRLSMIEAEHTLVIFWATWCPHCREILPQIFGFLSTRPDVKVVAIGLDEETKSWEAAIERFPGWYSIQAPEKWENRWAKLYGVSGTPTFFLLDKEHKIIGKPRNPEELKKMFP